MTDPASTMTTHRLASASFVLVAAFAPLNARAADPSPAPFDGRELALLNRVTWGVSETDARSMAAMGPERWLDRQLHSRPDDPLPHEAQAQIDANTDGGTTMANVVIAMRARQKSIGAISDPDQKKAAQKAYDADMNGELQRAVTRSLVRDLYSPDQLREQMTWFWFNHFSVQAAKSNLRLMVGDYEDNALRPHALGRFRDLLAATLRHPAMLRYLDNADNAAGHINENYAREIMELHTLGVDGGYSQKDVQELARILTGVGIDTNPQPPNLPPTLRGQLIRKGLFEFNPKRHDYGDKVFLGRRIRGRGFGEVEGALDILARNPATARHVSRQLAIYFVSDNPSDALVERMSQTFLRSDGRIAQVLATMFRSPEFQASLGTKFKDPVHYVLSSVRLAYGDRVVLNAGPIQGWLGRLGEALYNHPTPDGYSTVAAAWNGPGQMEARFEVAQKIGGGAGGLFKSDPAGAVNQPGVPILQNALYYEGLAQTLGGPTRTALAEAASPQDWNALFLSSPDFMHR